MEGLKVIEEAVTNRVDIKEPAVVAMVVEIMEVVMDTKEAMQGIRAIMEEDTKTKEDTNLKIEDILINMITEVKVTAIIVGNIIDIEVCKELDGKEGTNH